MAAVCLALGQLAADNGWWDLGSVVPRCGAAAATWFGLLLLARRIGLPISVVAGYAAVALGLAMAFPAGWALSAASVAAASTYGLLAVAVTRAAAGWAAIRELVAAGVVAVAGAVVVSGFGVTLRVFRFRTLVLVLALAAALALAHRLTATTARLRRPGQVLVVTAVLAFLVFVGIVQGVGHLGGGSGSGAGSGDDVGEGVLTLWRSISVRPVAAFVGLPALVWGVARRSRTPAGWWLCAFGVLGTAGIATSLLQPSVEPGSSLATTGWTVLVGAALGLLAVGVEALAVRRRVGETAARERVACEGVDRDGGGGGSGTPVEPDRWAPLLSE